MNTTPGILAAILLVAGFSSCRKDPPGQTGGNPNEKLNYGDSIFYLQAQTYEISPVQARTGTYTAFPENLLIDPASGKITVKIMGLGLESQTGLRYKINYTSSDGQVKDSTYIVLAGINYLDQVYYLSQNDSLIYPVYNARLSNPVPGGVYECDDNDVAIDPATGVINVKETMRRGLFNIPVENGEWEEVSIKYRSNDASNQVLNRIDIALYYYDGLNDVPSNVSALMREHQKMTLGVPQEEVPVTTGGIDLDLPDNISMFRPRPPCIVIVAN